MAEQRLTATLRRALLWLAAEDGWGVVTSSSSGLYDGQPWINHNTVEALRVRGLVELESEPDGGYLVRLNDDGLRAAALGRGNS